MNWSILNTWLYLPTYFERSQMGLSGVIAVITFTGLITLLITGLAAGLATGVAIGLTTGLTWRMRLLLFLYVELLLLMGLVPCWQVEQRNDPGEASKRTTSFPRCEFWAEQLGGCHCSKKSKHWYHRSVHLVFDSVSIPASWNEVNQWQVVSWRLPPWPPVVLPSKISVLAWRGHDAILILKYIIQW
jgi:uncharacterized membrane protein